MESLVINLDKPKGMTSQEAVTAVKRLFHAKKAGHAGTLDPIATGILLICLNEATKITRFLTDLDKEYIARIKLGERTDTLDSEGKVIERAENLSVTREQIMRVLNRFVGEIEQTPPMYSAIKMDGEPLYRLARKGVTVERQKRRVRIYRIDLLGFETPFIDIRVSCSKGTYIRSLCSDIGDALMVGGHIVELRRVASGSFRVTDSITLNDLRYKLERVGLKPAVCDLKSVLTIDVALRDMEEVFLHDRDVWKAKNGIALRLTKNLKAARGYVRLKDADGSLFGIGRVEGDLIKIERILHL